jgi:hypothetical protein
LYRVAGRQHRGTEDTVPQRLRRYPELLAQIKLYAFETISTIVVLVLFAQFALHEIRPAINAIFNYFRSP